VNKVVTKVEKESPAPALFSQCKEPAETLWLFGKDVLNTLDEYKLAVRKCVVTVDTLYEWHYPRAPEQ
jgi:hypothetical protein